MHPPMHLKPPLLSVSCFFFVSLLITSHTQVPRGRCCWGVLVRWEWLNGGGCDIPWSSVGRGAVCWGSSHLMQPYRARLNLICIVRWRTIYEFIWMGVYLLVFLGIGCERCGTCVVLSHTDLCPPLATACPVRGTEAGEWSLGCTIYLGLTRLWIISCSLLLLQCKTVLGSFF